MTEKQRQIAEEALARAANGRTTSNWGAIFAGFEAKGIPADDIRPRENVLTYHAWRAKGRQVRRGEHGVKVLTWIPIEETRREKAEAERVKAEGKTAKSRPHCQPRSATVFHISQTDAIES